MSSHILSKFKSKVLVVENFFDADFCAELRAEARANAGAEASVTNRGMIEVKKDVRSTQVASVDTPAIARIKARMLELMPELEKHFNVALEGCNRPHYLIYRPGDFFQAHRDNTRDPLDSAEVRGRRVSVVVFLNGESKEPGPESYMGGSLAFYELIDDPRCKAIGLPVSGKPGLLIAFPSDVMHEVAPVTHGERYTVITWFY